MLYKENQLDKKKSSPYGNGMLVLVKSGNGKTLVMIWRLAPFIFIEEIAGKFEKKNWWIVLLKSIDRFVYNNLLDLQ